MWKVGKEEGRGEGGKDEGRGGEGRAGKGRERKGRGRKGLSFFTKMAWERIQHSSHTVAHH